MHCVYILQSNKLNRFYTGYTANFDLRMVFHENPEPHKFTAKTDDWKLYLRIECKKKDQALCIEKHIKSRKSKVYVQNLLKYPEMIFKLVEKFKPGC